MSQMGIQKLLEKMWIDYCAMNPAAKKIYDMFRAEGEDVQNDHIALRTVNHPRLGIKSLSQHFEKYGYVYSGEYHFVEKKLYAQHFQHADESLPKIFISELLLEKMSPFVRDTMNELASKVPDSLIQSETFSFCGRPWDVSFKTYNTLATESEYASWVAAYGFRPNHFTVNVNNLKHFKDLPKLNAFIEKAGYTLNKSGGVIKGTPSDYLEQSSTMAEEIPVAFSDGTHKIPGCYYEFAKRYALDNGKLYQGFVAKSADKIFESTNKIR